MALRRNLKLSPKFCSPYHITQRIGAVAYKLDLPKESRIHLVFHVSLLKKKLSQRATVQVELPATRDGDDVVIPRPKAILDQRVHNKKKKQLLVHWHGLSPAEAAWEDFQTIVAQFPELGLEDKT